MSTLVDLWGHLRPLSDVSRNPIIVRITENSQARGASSALIMREGDEPTLGFAAYLMHSNEAGRHPTNSFLLPKSLHYLAEGDVVRIDPSRRRLNTIYRMSSPSNSLLVTERCDNYCLMCSQPPKTHDDGWLIDDLLTAIPLFDPATETLGITGGEPALLGSRLLELLVAIKTHLPNTAVHILSNGRAFADPALACELARIGISNLMIGIPVYSDLPEEHDFVVQARGAFNETVRGILNLKRCRVKVEIRFVVHRETFARLPHFAQFLARNLLFVDHVALMGLELMGFGKANVEALWIDPVDYIQQLSQAVKTLARARMPVSIYNHQLCVLPADLHAFARRSISDWKNWYPDECHMCSLREECGGFFVSSTLRRSRGILPIVDAGGIA